MLLGAVFLVLAPLIACGDPAGSAAAAATASSSSGFPEGYGRRCGPQVDGFGRQTVGPGISQADCAPPLVCDGVCGFVDAPAGTPCRFDAPGTRCAPGLHCDGAANACAPAGGPDAWCAYDRDCEAGLFCWYATPPETDLGEPQNQVLGGGRCSAPHGEGGACPVYPYQDEWATAGESPCASELHCALDAHVCERRASAGRPCDGDAECASGTCKDNPACEPYRSGCQYFRVCG